MVTKQSAPAFGERKSRLLRRAPHPTSPLRTPRNDTVGVSFNDPFRANDEVLPRLLRSFCNFASRSSLVQQCAEFSSKQYHKRRIIYPEKRDGD